jgi:hypothetical protein
MSAWDMASAKEQISGNVFAARIGGLNPPKSAGKGAELGLNAGSPRTKFGAIRPIHAKIVLLNERCS